jgi:hypothetical protein
VQQRGVISLTPGLDIIKEYVEALVKNKNKKERRRRGRGKPVAH